MNVNLSSTSGGVLKRLWIASRTSSHLSLRLFPSLDDACDIGRGVRGSDITECGVAG